MLAPYRPQFIEKILTDAYGRRYRVVFAVSYLNGEVRGHIVSARAIEAVLKLSGQVTDTIGQLRLSGSCSSKEPEEIVSPYAPIVTPYLSLDYLINSQPTRAPSHI